MTGWGLPQSDAQDRAIAAMRGDATPPKAMVLADMSGKYFRWTCRACNQEGVTRLSKERAMGEAARHNQNWHAE